VDTKPAAPRRYYLQDLPLDEAQARLHAALRRVEKAAPLPGEIVPLTAALGRVTAEPVYARLSAPHYHAAAMDGYAVRAASTHAATETRPVTLKVNTDAHPVNTGDPLPVGMDAVIMIEQVEEQTTDGVVTAIAIRQPAPPYQHVRMTGEDMIATELVLPADHLLRPVDLGALAGSGHAAVGVRRRARVVIIPAGSELVSAADAAAGVQPGQIIEYNSLVLAGQCAEIGADAVTLPIVPDDPALLAAALDGAIASTPDLILLLSGSSAGSRDYTVSTIEARGEVFVHGVAVRPGHPVIIGLVDGIPVIGVPGYPVSAVVCFEELVRPLLAWLRDSFALARRDKLAGVVVAMQANPGFRQFNRGLGHPGFKQLLETLRAETEAFPGQVLFLHGDTHSHQIDQPLLAGNGETLTRFTRVESYGSPFLGWVKVIVDDQTPGLFRFESHPWPR